MIEVKHLSKLYHLSRKKQFMAVNNVSFTIHRGEIFGLMGASGSGKSTLARLLLGLLPPTSGAIFFDGAPVTSLMPRKMQMVFQDPYSSLNPRMTIGKILKEPTTIHNLPDRTEELLALVNLPLSMRERYPHELSGGQRQRIGIARALALNPEFLICDEPISSLDVSVQAQIVNLLKQLQKELNLTILFIAHDPAIIRYLSDRACVMEKGALVELAETEKLFTEPSHPYTCQLLSPLARLQEFSGR